MYRLTRISAEPASPLKIQIARPDGADAGLTAGGSLVLEPGDEVQVDDYVAGVIMGDPSLARHFECLPPWKSPEQRLADDAAAPEPVTEGHIKRAGANPVPQTSKPGAFAPPGQGKRHN